MRASKLWLVVLIVLAMAIQLPVQALGADAAASPENNGTTPFERARLDGKEMNSTTRFAWHNPSMFDSDVQSQVIGPIVDALQVVTSSGTTEDGAYYSTVDLLLSDTSIFKLDTYASEDCVYLNSPAFGGAVGMRMDELPNFYESLGEALDNMAASQDSSFEASGISFKEIYGQMGEALREQLETTAKFSTGAETIDDMDSFEAYLESVLDVYKMDDVIAAIEAWEADALAPTVYEGDIVTSLDVEPVRAEVFTMEKDDLMALLDAAIPLMLENDGLMMQFIQQAAMQNPLMEMPDPEEVLSAYREQVERHIESIREDFAEDAIAQYVQGYDADDAIVLGQFEFLYPAQSEYESDSAIAVEWSPITGNAFASMGDDDFNITFRVANNGTEIIEEDAMTTETSGCLMTLTMAGWSGETVFEGVLSYDASTTYDESMFSRDRTLILGGIAPYSESMGIEFSMHESNITVPDIGSDDESQMPIIAFTVLDATLLIGEERERIMSIDTTATIDGTKGPAFDPATFEGEISQIGLMSADELMLWIQNVVTPGMMQFVMRAMSALPQNTLSYMLQESGAY